MNHNIKSEIQLVLPVGADGAGGYSVTAGTPVASRQYTNSTTNTIVTSDGALVTIAAGQKAFVQNLDDAAVYVRYGTGASASNFTFVLKAGTAANDGTGGSAIIDDFAGIVSILAAAGSPRVNVALFT